MGRVADMESPLIFESINTLIFKSYRGTGDGISLPRSGMPCIAWAPSVCMYFYFDPA